jgi:hypothetical protein
LRKTLCTGLVENCLERLYDLGSDALEGFRIVNILASADAASTIRTVRCQLGMILVKVALRGSGSYAIAPFGIKSTRQQHGTGSLSKNLLSTIGALLSRIMISRMKRVSSSRRQNVT